MFVFHFIFSTFFQPRLLVPHVYHHLQSGELIDRWNADNSFRLFSRRIGDLMHTARPDYFEDCDPNFYTKCKLNLMDRCFRYKKYIFFNF